MEHKAILNRIEAKSFKKQRVGDGIHLVLAKTDAGLTPVSYNFKNDRYTSDEAKEWMEKAGVDYMELINARLSLKASESQKSDETTGRIWSSGVHSVFVNGKPSRVYVNEDTIEKTFKDLRTKIQEDGRIPLGVDHLSEDILMQNQILAKMNLLDVGDIHRIGFDGSGIYILDSEIKNDSIKTLNASGEIPAYSVVGKMNADPCPTGQVDYVLRDIDIERVDFVEAGGCQVCTTGAEPDELILTSKKAETGEDIMANETKQEDETKEQGQESQESNEVNQTENVEDKKEDQKEVKVPKEELQDKEKPESQEEEKDQSQDEKSQDKEPEEDEKDQTIKDLQKRVEELEGKKANVEAKSTFNAESEVDNLIKEGKALPKMRDALLEVAAKSPEAFKSMADEMPTFVDMEMKGKLAKQEKQEKPKKKDKKAYFESDEYKEDLKAFGM